MDSAVMGLVWVLIVLASISGAVVGAVVLYRQNKAKTERTQAMFGVGGPGPVPGGAQAPGQAVVLGKRTYAWPDRTGYYVTFQVGGQQPVEVEVSPEWYGYLNAGDRGALTLQGGQFGGFARVG
jgi:hypothetical protein